MRAIVTGASGLLGSYLLKTVPQGIEIYSKRFDILSKDDTYAAFDEAKPDIVIHCAGEGRVDFAESNRCNTWRTTYEGLELIMRASHYWKSHLVYISSNAVYNGKEYPSNEDTLHDSVNTYGLYKSTCEELLKFYHHKTTIIRPILLYGWPQEGRRDNFVTRLIRDLNTIDLKTFGLIPVDCEIISQPTYAYDCAAAIWKIIFMQIEKCDAINVAQKERISLFKFAVEVKMIFFHIYI